MRKRTARQIPREPGSEEIVHVETRESLSSKILKMTMRIKEKHPELSKYLEEMAVTIPDEKNPEISLTSLNAYYDSLYSLVNKYELEHPARPTI
ncbi:MAG: hypothetical protein ACJ76F_11280 [Bacteroidia bacterium]